MSCTMNRIWIAAVVGLVLTIARSGHADFGDQLFKLLGDDGAADDHFGFSVATSGDTAIVGARSDDDNGDFSGSAYLFDTTTGRQIAKLLPDDRAAGFNFGWSVAISEVTVLVGAPGDDHSGSFSGSVYVFDTTTGRQIAKLLADDAHPGTFFGGAVAISGPPGKEVVIVGAWADNEQGPATGSAYLFDISDPANPVQTAKLLAIDGEADDDFGISVAISGATAIVGAWFDNDNGLLSGSTYLFDIITGQQIAKLVPDDGAALDLFAPRKGSRHRRGPVGRRQRH